MMDIELHWKDGYGDIQVVDGDLATTDDLFTNDVLTSLFTDLRAEAYEVEDSEDLRGWWGFAVGETFGSHLWLLEREKLSQEVIAKAKDYAQKATAWIGTPIEIERPVELDRLYIKVDGKEYGL